MDNNPEFASLSIPMDTPHSPLARVIASNAGMELIEEIQAITTEDRWIELGQTLGAAERTLGWIIGAWWNAGERFGRRVEIVSATEWTGPSHKTCRNYAMVDAAIEVSRRRDTLSFSHHAEVAKLAPEQADALLDRAERQMRETGVAPPSRMLRQWAKAEARQTREEALASATARASARLGHQLYSVIYADPPWRFEARSEESGMDRAADNHYQTMSTAEICQLKVPSAPHSVLFLWATRPMLGDAFEVLQAWGFTYKTDLVWIKPSGGTGYWARDAHEHLLIATRGRPPAPAPGKQPMSWATAPRTRHSEKPALFREMIDRMFPSQVGLEMFARSGCDGWDSWGNETWQP